MIPLQNKSGISNPDIFNHNLHSVITSVNEQILNGMNTENQINSAVAIYDTNLMEQLRFKIQDIESKIKILKLLRSNDKFTHVELIKEWDNNAPAAIFLNPKDNVTMLSAYKTIVSGNDISLQESQSAAAVIKSVSVVGHNTEYKDGIIKTFIVQSSPDPITIQVKIELESSSEFNQIVFDNTSDAVFDIIKVGDNVVSYQNFYGKNSIAIPSATASEIILEAKLHQCRGTNFYQPSANVNESIYFNASANLNNKFNNYIFSFGIGNIEVKNIESVSPSIFISKEYRVDELAQIAFDADPFMSGASADYYIYVEDFNKDGELLGKEYIPVTTPDVTSIQNEVLYPVSPNVASVTVGNIVYNVYKIATLNFVPDNLILYKNGVEIINSPLKYHIDGRTVYFLHNINTSDIITANYTIEHTKYAIYPYGNISNERIESFSYSKSLIVNFDTENLVELDPNLPDPNHYIRFALGYAPKDASVSAKKIRNDAEDTNAPLFEFSGESTNSYVVGRFVYLPCDITLYPQLTNTVFEISYELNQPSLVPEIKIFYMQDNSILFNWEYLKNIENFGYSEIRLIAIIKANSDSPVGQCVISSPTIYFNTFNDLIGLQ